MDRLLGRVPAEPLSHLERMSYKHGDPWGPVAQRWDKGEAQRAVGDLVPYDPSAEMPDEGGRIL